MYTSGKIPETWVQATIGDVCSQPQYGYTTKAAQNGDLRLLRTTDITSGGIIWETVPYCSEKPDDPETYLLEDGDIVVSRAGSVGVSQLITKPKRAVFASYLIRFKPLINRSFLGYFLKSPDYWASISDKKLGIAVPNVNATKLKSIPVPVPPAREQTQIVAKIEELFFELEKGIERLKTARAQLSIYRQAVLKHAFEGKLTAQWRKENKDNIEKSEQLLARIKRECEMLYERQLQKWKDSVEEWEDKGRSGKKPSKPQRPNVQGGRRIERGVSGMKYNRHECEETKNPYGWQRCVLRDFANIVMGQSPSSKTYNQRGDGFPFFQGKAEFGDVYPTINMYCSQPKKIAKQGATLLSVRAPVGPTNLVQHDCCIGRGLAAIHPCGGIQPKFLLYLLRSIEPAISGKGTGSTFKAITKKFVEGLEFNLPPLSEQRCIVAKIEEKLSVVEELYLTLDRQLQKGNFLRQSILKKAFAGQLVEQDPEDELASVLLDRIRVERKKTMKNKNLKKKTLKKNKQRGVT